MESYSFSRFGSIVRTDTDRHARADADERYTPTTLVGVRKYVGLRYNVNFCVCCDVD